MQATAALVSFDHWLSTTLKTENQFKSVGFYPSILRVEHGPEVYSKTHGGAVSKEDAPTKLRFFDRLKGRTPLFISRLQHLLHWSLAHAGWSLAHAGRFKLCFWHDRD